MQRDEMPAGTSHAGVLMEPAMEPAIEPAIHPAILPAIDAVRGADDLALLQAYEPVIRFTAGELFLPTAVEPYVAASSLWRFDQGGEATCLVPAGQLTMDRLLDESRGEPGADLSLKFVDKPLDRRAYRAWRKRPHRPRFHSHGRFAKVGILARLIDAVFRVVLLLRGRVPGGVAAGAEETYRQHLGADSHPYYGRVVREGGYVALQYWYFYAMNDWRSTFGGANDHEADWEMVLVYLTEQPDGALAPAWVAFSAHDEVGDDLRRRWDDPDLQRVGDHPVVFAGAGSHSGAFLPGEYVTAINPPGYLRPVFVGVQRLARLLAPWSRGEIATGVGIPFVDYARGDGETIGADQARTWSGVVIGDDTPWVRDYRGLWGLDTRDRFGGERAPAGPRYDRGGTVRPSWADPLGWAGLQKVPASGSESEVLLRRRLSEIDAALPDVEDDVDRSRRELRQLVAEADSLGDRQGFEAAVLERRARAAAGEKALGALVVQRDALVAERAVHLDTLARPRPAVDAQAHLHHRHLPSGRSAEVHRARFLRVWSTISTPLLFVAAAWLAVDPSGGLVASVVLYAVVFLGIEAIARRRLLAFVVSVFGVALGISAVTAIVQGVYGQWQVVLAALLGIAASAVLVANLRDLRRG